MDETNPKLITDDEMRPDYGADFFKRGVRGKYTAALQAGYTVTVHHGDGTATRKVVPPVTTSGEAEAATVALSDAEPVGG